MSATTPMMSNANQNMGFVKIIACSPFVEMASCRLAWTVNAREPVKEPEAHRCGEIKDHLANFDLDVFLGRFCHRAPYVFRWGSMESNGGMIRAAGEGPSLTEPG